MDAEFWVSIAFVVFVGVALGLDHLVALLSRMAL
jgi:hypothetical protein